MRCSPFSLALCLLSVAPPLAAQQPPDGGTLVVAGPKEALSPVPTLWRNDQFNREVSDLLFLRLADVGPEVSTTNERSFLPRLASRWKRQDPRTLVFELDPRARWHDGTPVTAGDAVFALNRARDPKLSPQLATLLRRISRVTATDPRHVTVTFTEAYPEQLYDATYHAPPLPAHLLASIPPESLATSAFVQNPVGNGPYRFSRRVPDQLLELAANNAFFLGRPAIHRVLFLVATDGEARLNLLLSGTADAADNIYSLPNPARVEKLPDFFYYPVPGLNLQYATLNLRDPSDTSRPHPILADPVVRRALVLAIDRETISKLAFGRFTRTPSAPVSALVGRNAEAPPPLPYDTAQARRLLASRGWVDHDGDGVLDKDGRLLQLTAMVPPVASRRQMSAQMQEAYRRIGIQLLLEPLDIPVFIERRNAGKFDLDFYSTNQDPTPAGLTQSWSCAAPSSSNAGHYCNPSVDSLIALATVAPKDPGRLYREAVRRIAEDVPAIFIAAQVPVVAVHRRFTNVSLRPESIWANLWLWRVRPGQQLERDRQ